MGKWLIRLILLAIVAALVWFGATRLGTKTQTVVRTTTIAQGPLAMTVTATGHLAPTTEVLVGCEVSGTIEAVYVNHNDRVTKGQVIAKIRPEYYRAEYEQAKAELARANANVDLAATNQADAKRDLDHLTDLRGAGASASREFDKANAAYQAAQANKAIAEAAVATAQSRVELTEYRLGRTDIVSPIDGIVLDRKVDAGQTVAATLMTPDLFVLAEDLARMELLADVSEADVGYVAPGQSARFAVNAYRDREFIGRVQQIRNKPRIVSNVVTYTVVIEVDNAERLLRPGMPADVEIETVMNDDVSKIANAALRFKPPLPPDTVRSILDQVTWPAAPEAMEVVADLPDQSQAPAMVVKPPAIEAKKATLWRYIDQQWQAVGVWIGYTDDRETLIYADSGMLPETEFAVEIRKLEGSGGSLQKAFSLADPANRKL